MLRRHGSRIAFCADELYLTAGLPLPDYSYYEDFDQSGQRRRYHRPFADDSASPSSMEDGDEGRSHFSLATGEAAAPPAGAFETAKENSTGR